MNSDLHNYISVYDEKLPQEVLNNFKKFCKFNLNLSPGRIVSDSKETNNNVDKNIRNVEVHILQNLNAKTLTESHWTNFLSFVFTKTIEDYQKKFSLNGIFKVIDIQILKYQKGGHYKFHVDHGLKTPRTYSCIFFVNEDYEGGDLMFRYPGSDKTTKIEKKQNRLIVWPSDFLFPHTVTPVTEGERYSVVAWAL
jgi:predicted 2-oxoglutarate/Fe(II)-dependent dioxygenase YbiX